MYMYIWYRGTFPRYRFDQLMKVGWKVLLPLGIGVLILTRECRQRVRVRECRWTNMAPVATTFFFYFLSALTVLSGVLVITRKNAVHSALALIVSLLGQAALYLMLYAPFVAGVQIILYAGGIMVLFLFVIMLVNIEKAQKEEQFNKQWLVGLAAAMALGALFVLVLRKGQGPVSGPRNPDAGAVEYPAGRSPALRQLHVHLRNRLVAVAGGDHRSGSDGKEENLRSSFSH